MRRDATVPPAGGMRAAPSFTAKSDEWRGEYSYSIRRSVAVNSRARRRDRTSTDLWRSSHTPKGVGEGDSYGWMAQRLKWRMLGAVKEFTTRWAITQKETPSYDHHLPNPQAHQGRLRRRRSRPRRPGRSRLLQRGVLRRRGQRGEQLGRPRHH